MKKITVFLLTALFVMSMFFVLSCGNGEGNDTDAQSESAQAQPTETDKAETVAPETDEPETEGVDLSSYAFVKEFELPEDFRQAAVDYMVRQSEIVWICSETFSTRENFTDAGWGIDLKSHVIAELGIIDGRLCVSALRGFGRVRRLSRFNLC